MWAVQPHIPRNEQLSRSGRFGRGAVLSAVSCWGGEEESGRWEVVIERARAVSRTTKYKGAR